ncbi:MAG TPA: KOW domain-containing RNA-binding protein [Clostridiales bacterium]|jgi:ribosomal protein L14E/L6E/L27E|nr:KOW domain-containing RNA-binding protein [Clostridiales bacterium]HQD72192.1 KOW domain-containing RNA-binding protein [Clostridiales bacterium]
MLWNGLCSEGVINLELTLGCIVRSKAGRDKGKFLVVTAIEDNAVLLCDGKERPLERPKRKNIKHIAVTTAVLGADDMANNRALRRALRNYAQRTTQKQDQGR